MVAMCNLWNSLYGVFDLLSPSNTPFSPGGRAFCHHDKGSRIGSHEGWHFSLPAVKNKTCSGITDQTRVGVTGKNCLSLSVTTENAYVGFENTLIAA